ncbi:MAG: ABC transporter ATP-binding protein [Planctomycetes bacterium]|nr:ABC transporter ATP-binding protein [Planctomycetota bacterium]
MSDPFAAAPSPSPSPAVAPASGPTREATVRVAAVAKTYYRDQQPIPVLENIDLTIQSGEFVALMGPSGSGKTTLLNLVAGIDRPSSGSVVVAGNDLHGMSERQLAAFRSRHVGFIFQFYNLIPVLTAFENVELPLLLTSLSKAERRKHVATALEVVGLSDRRDHYPRQLSGGQEQRVAIARAVVTDPTVLLADEPTGDLDKRSEEEVLVLLRRLNQEFAKTILMVTHDPKAAASAGRTVRIEKGALVAAPKDGQA